MEKVDQDSTNKAENRKEYLKLWENEDEKYSKAKRASIYKKGSQKGK